MVAGSLVLATKLREPTQRRNVDIVCPGKSDTANGDIIMFAVIQKYVDGTLPIQYRTVISMSQCEECFQSVILDLEVVATSWLAVIGQNPDYVVCILLNN
jgi:hypothetical protein